MAISGTVGGGKGGAWRAGDVRGLVCLLLVAGLASCGGSGGGDGVTDPDNGSVPSGRIVLSHLPVPLSEMLKFIGLGEPNVFPKDHGGFVFAARAEADIPVFAVAAGRIRHLRKYPGFDGEEDFALLMRVSTTMEVQVAHLDAWRRQYSLL